MGNYFLDTAYGLDRLAIIMLMLITYIGICVLVFASHYMKGDSKYRSFFVHIILLICSVVIMVGADNLWLLLITSCFSNLLLVRLMIHKSTWNAAYASGMIAAKNYLLSATCMALAFTIFYLSTGQTSINLLIQQNNQSVIMALALVLLLVAAMAQSALWPFHKWLIGSLNSPTPVSAIMHAGLINGGGFLLVRFAPLYLQHPQIMSFIFFIGMVTALLGTLWKLMQSDVKRMLACSTIGQMGFMFVQCGLGLFPLAIVHLFCHGMFKAYLFLASSSAAQEKSADFAMTPKIPTFVCAFICGVAGSFIFADTTDKPWFAEDGTLVLTAIAFFASTQMAFSIMRRLTFKSFSLAFIATASAAFMYGNSVHFIASILAQLGLMQPQPLNIVHILGIAALALTWVSIFFFRTSPLAITNSAWMRKTYVKALNASQPHPDTITSHRNHYQY